MEYCVSVFDYIPPNTHYVQRVTFFEHTIETLVTNTPSSVDTWISETERLHSFCPYLSTLVGLDVEWRPNQTRNSENPVATLQLCFGRRCLVFQILHSPSIPQSLLNFLRNPSHRFAGVGIENDVEKLRRDYNLEVAKTVDLRTVAAERYGVRELRNAGLKQLAWRVLGREISKPESVTRSMWDDQYLTPAQVQYAAIDAFLSFEIGRVLGLGESEFVI
ncbi:hypothetical protein SSX86_030794 [Deinandra increscens subsp. villosa]|uniref:3'-5' exonuclease domain-containing protein n=1 Tax=Deinandra increscens subsp. villosa TaxID=3103831 RepID=A0AAP0GI99_9ASTR